ncbi:hypothetical protein Dsin_017672 [Dipteronia sinensis]|uniref:Uncharacterized protein n=1 Tax=Dipteronia sinensis TaxID=43782 RepID=A0AAE0AFF6_9ROSI|nr:hypothetical protein Dsin_017672 [Dipteronia sinensis]
MPSQKLRFLNKACIIRDAHEDLTPDGETSNPWSLCTVEQVEELKALIKVIPIWSTEIMISMTMNQTSIPVLQANSMDRHITLNLQILVGSFSMFIIISLIVWLALYDRIMVPVESKIRGKPSGLGLKARMGTELAFSVAAMASWATAESLCRRIAIEQGIMGDLEAVVNMSAIWLLPQYILSGFGEAFNAIGQNEFFYTEFPKTMSSIAASLYRVGSSVSTLVASFILNAVDFVTTREGKKRWVTSNINDGHYDYYLWLLAGLSLDNLVYYIVCSKA